MGGRKTSWSDNSLQQQGGPNKARKVHLADGDAIVFRVMSDPIEVRSHTVPTGKIKANGEEGAFSKNCSKSWDEKGNKWSGECPGCDEKLKLNVHHIVGVSIVAKKAGGGKTKKVESDEAPHWWKMGKDKTSQLHRIALDLKEDEIEVNGKQATIFDVELKAALTDDKAAVDFQKTTISRRDSSAKRFVEDDEFKDYKEAYHEQEDELFAPLLETPDKAEWTRALGVKDKNRQDNDAKELDDDEDLEEEKPKETKKRRTRKAKESPKKETEELEEDIDDVLDDL